MAYNTYQILIATEGFAKHLEVVAVDMKSAHADVLAAFPDVRIVQTMQVKG
jgi:hypothetical protein